MTTHEHFLAAIAAQPNEPGARLVYADWLEDQGDARAELIRVMEEMHTLAPYSDRFWELRPRRAKLKQGVSDEWLAALGYRPLFTKMPAERGHRWRLISEFLETWHGPLVDAPGHSEEEIVASEERLGLRLPAAMREWYGRFGRSRKFWDLDDDTDEIFRWNDVAQLDVDIEHLWFATEFNHVRWGVRRSDVDLHDPSVYGFDVQVRRFGPLSLSQFATVKLFDLVMERCSERYLFGVDLLSDLSGSFVRADHPEEWSVSGSGAREYWESFDAICIVSHSGQQWLCFRTPAAMKRLVELRNQGVAGLARRG